MSDETSVPAENGRTMKEISKDLQTAGFEESPQPEGEGADLVPEPSKLTPEEMKQDPEQLIETDEDADAKPDQGSPDEHIDE
jgi:hypothetical protein